MNPVPLHEFECELKVFLNREEQEIARKEINLHFFNDTICNHWVDGNLVPKYPEIEKANPQILDAYYNICGSHRVIIVMQLMSDGTLKQVN